MKLVLFFSLEVDDVLVEILERVDQRLDLERASIFHLTERLDIDTQSGEDPDRLEDYV